MRTSWSFPAIAFLTAACSGEIVPGVEEDDDERLTQSGCGVERWSVKTGTDPDVGTIQQIAQDTTIAVLTGIPAPSSRPANGRIVPQERQVYRLRDVTLTEYKLESDSDFHLVVKDGSSGMIVEIPSPGCVGGSSPLAAGIASARSAFAARHSPGTSFTMVNETVSVIGVGFFDAPHGQTGVAPNAMELHPVLGVCFGAGCDPGGGSGGGSDMASMFPDMAMPPPDMAPPPPPKDMASPPKDMTTSGACGHSPCTAGAKLKSTCDPCVTKVCASDKYCCSVKWDAQCVMEVAARCGPVCGM